MKQIQISTSILKSLPQTKIGYIQANVKIEKFNKELWSEIQNLIEDLKKLDFDKIKQILQISFTRQAYKKLGKDPSRYRPSAESLFRRIVKNKNLYQINNAVDTINFASLKTGFSIGGYDFDKINGNIIIFDTGKKDEIYEGIGRGLLNIENMPVFKDDTGPFGSPTSDSERTKIDINTKTILLLVVNFGTNRDFKKDLSEIAKMIEKYCYGSQIITKICPENQ